MFTTNNNNRSNLTLYNLNNTGTPNNINNNNVSTIMPFSKKYSMFKMRQDTLVKPPPINQTPSEPIISDKKGGMIWGKPIWTLFHTLAEKISEDSFTVVGNDLIEIIIKICGNLPCPTCTEHAMNYMAKNRFNTMYIQTKQQLRNELFKFHNFVNNNKGHQQFQIEKLSESYMNLDTIVVIRDFMTVFKDKHFSIRMIANDFHRNRIVSQLTGWFNMNIKYFI